MATTRIHVRDFAQHPDAIYCGRPHSRVPKAMARRTELGNPFRLRFNRPADRRLVCAHEDEQCHLDEILFLLNEWTDDELRSGRIKLGGRA